MSSIVAEEVLGVIHSTEGYFTAQRGYFAVLKGTLRGTEGYFEVLRST